MVNTMEGIVSPFYKHHLRAQRDFDDIVGVPLFNVEEPLQEVWTMREKCSL